MVIPSEAVDDDDKVVLDGEDAVVEGELVLLEGVDDVGGLVVLVDDDKVEVRTDEAVEATVVDGALVGATVDDG